jgi:Carboxyl transferase domain
MLGEIFDAASNPERKKPFDLRSLLRGVADADHPTLERWADMADAESAVVLDAHLGGQPVALIGFESRPLPRHGAFPVDGPSQWTAGTLFPRSSKKTARAINAASGNRPPARDAPDAGRAASPPRPIRAGPGEDFRVHDGPLPPIRYNQLTYYPK